MTSTILQALDDIKEKIKNLEDLNSKLKKTVHSEINRSDFRKELEDHVCNIVSKSLAILKDSKELQNLKNLRDLANLRH